MIARRVIERPKSQPYNITPCHRPLSCGSKIAPTQMQSYTIALNLLPGILPVISTKIQPSVGRGSIADDVARGAAGRLSNDGAPLAGVISRGALKFAARGSHRGEVGRALVGGEGLSVDSREVEPGLAVGVDGQLELVLVGAGDVIVGRALHDGADVVLHRMRFSQFLLEDSWTPL
jgi:hypothetical protein